MTVHFVFLPKNGINLKQIFFSKCEHVFISKYFFKKTVVAKFFSSLSLPAIMFENGFRHFYLISQDVCNAKTASRGQV
jgi:hypothetical protein